MRDSVIKVRAGGVVWSDLLKMGFGGAEGGREYGEKFVRFGTECGKTLLREYAGFDQEFEPEYCLVNLFDHDRPFGNEICR